MLLTRQTGALHIGEVTRLVVLYSASHCTSFDETDDLHRYTLTYTPSADPGAPNPAELFLKVKNTSALPLRAAYLHGPYTLYAACYPADFDPKFKHDAQGVPQFEPFLKAGGSWDAVITVPSYLRMPEAPTSPGYERGGGVTWIIEISSQVVFSSSAVVHFEVLVGRHENPTDFSNRSAASGLPPSGQLHEHWTSETRGYQVPVTKGVYSNSILLLIDDTASLWNTPSLSLSRGKGRSFAGPNESGSTQSSTVGIPEGTDTVKSNKEVPSRRKVHLVVLTHGLHSNIGSDMLYLKESIDRAARQAKGEQTKDHK